MTTSSLILSTDQQAQVDLLAQTLDRDQAIWLSGYFAGFAAHGTGAAATSPTAMAVSNGNGAGVAVPTTATPTATPATRLLTILYGTDTGNSKELATELATAAKAQGRESKVADMADYKPRGLKDEQDLLVVTATHGEGDPPPAAVGFFEFLAGRKAPKLAGVRFAVLALGDSTYEHYCSAGKQVDARLEELGAERIADRVDCDVDYEDDAASWIADVVAKLAPTESAPVASAPVINGVADGAGAPAAYGKKHPFQASVLENVVLTGRGSTKETRHVELSIADSGLTYQPGDALGVVPQNDPELVATLLDRLSLSAGVTVTTKKGPLPLDEALTRTFEITAG
ncbi:MAG: flavodoxin domain-containing protein, partial [Solirubrobacteraceae bacterium]